MKASLSSLEV
ncbi:hypothetical protein N499_0187A, partial [Wolbachia pipientis wVitA]